MSQYSGYFALNRDVFISLVLFWSLQLAEDFYTDQHVELKEIIIIHEFHIYFKTLFIIS